MRQCLNFSRINASDSNQTNNQQHGYYRIREMLHLNGLFSENITLYVIEHKMLLFWGGYLGNILRRSNLNKWLSNIATENRKRSKREDSPEISFPLSYKKTTPQEKLRGTGQTLFVDQMSSGI